MLRSEGQSRAGSGFKLPIHIASPYSHACLPDPPEEEKDLNWVETKNNWDSSFRKC